MTRVPTHATKYTGTVKVLPRKLRPTAMLIYTVPTLYFYARTYVGFPTGHVRVGPTTAPLEAREFRLLTKPELDSVD